MSKCALTFIVTVLLLALAAAQEDQWEEQVPTTATTARERLSPHLTFSLQDDDSSDTDDEDEFATAFAQSRLRKYGGYRSSVTGHVIIHSGGHTTQGYYGDYPTKDDNGQPIIYDTISPTNVGDTFAPSVAPTTAAPTTPAPTPSPTTPVPTTEPTPSPTCHIADERPAGCPCGATSEKNIFKLVENPTSSRNLLGRRAKAELCTKTRVRRRNSIWRRCDGCSNKNKCPDESNCGYSNEDEGLIEGAEDQAEDDFFEAMEAAKHDHDHH